MKLEEFLIKEEGDDSRRLEDGRFAATWDAIGKVWNIGPGLTHGVAKDTVWTQAQLDAAEAKEYADTRATVARLVKVTLGENQRTALESLTYNIGDAGFAHSTVLRLVNAGNFSAVPAALRMWNKAKGQVIQGLINRREHEVTLWNHPDDAPAPASLKTPQRISPATMEDSMPATSNAATPVSIPLAASNAVINPRLAHAITIMGYVGFALAATGIDSHNLLSSMLSGVPLAGALITGLSIFVHSSIVNGSNNATVEAIGAAVSQFLPNPPTAA